MTTYTHSTIVAGIPWKNPVATASGTFLAEASTQYYDVSELGAVTTKGVSPIPWEGNPSPRTAESPSGTVNSVGLQNPGIDHYLANDLPQLKQLGATVITNVAGHTPDDYIQVVKKLDNSPADMLEINVSCPNVNAGGLSIGTDPTTLYNLITDLRKTTNKPLIVKLTPNVTDITTIAKAATDAGADALSLINTLIGMRINTTTGQPILANTTGGLSGPAILPIGLANVWKVRTALPHTPIIGIGGIHNAHTALEYLYAGANAIEIGATALLNPQAPHTIAQELETLLDQRPALAAKLAAGETWR
ncbi:dihydroorotate dehydrogenase [Bifidobacterium magnum]|uniref:dihydroorotate dehydrogenase n=1 Tax=Bifidobacterium magnum TaxID=1692 RepID=UPI0003B49876|nr:dihydroorotate dehydrogenase [Bifidobacterium magnum]